MKENNSKSERRRIAAQLGSRGGLATVKKHGKKYMKEISKLGVKAREK